MPFGVRAECPPECPPVYHGMSRIRFYPKSMNAKRASIQIVVRAGDGGKVSIKLGTGLMVDHPGKNWDVTRDRVKPSYRLAQPINTRLSEIHGEAQRLFMHAVTTLKIDPFSYVKDELPKTGLLGAGRPSKSIDAPPAAPPVLLLEVFDRFCDSKRGEYAEATLKSYGTTRMHLADFQAKRGVPSFANGVNAEWVDAFRKYLRKRGLTDNSLRRSLKILKTCLKWADERGHITDTSYIRAIKLGNEKESVAVALTKEQLERIEQIDLSVRPGLDRIRWWFISQCCTGVRFADLHKVAAINVRDGFLPIQPKKTKDQFVKLPISPLLSRAFERLGDRQLDFTAQHYNRMLKELGRLLEFSETTHHVTFKGGKRIENTVPMHDLLSSHTARRTFITILLRAGYPQELVMKLSGHRDVRSFMKYVKMTERDATEAMQNVFN